MIVTSPLSVSAGCPIQALFWLEWGVLGPHPGSAIIEALRVSGTCLTQRKAFSRQTSHRRETSPPELQLEAQALRFADSQNPARSPGSRFQQNHLAP